MINKEHARNRALERFRLGLVTKAPIGAGAFLPGSIMLVGERTSHPERNKYHAPFCSIKACSGWLNTLLEAAGVPETKLFWVNALDNDGTNVNLRELYDIINPPSVIALGKVAEHALAEQGITAISVPHPQYWKRFKSKQEYPLIPILKGLVVV